MRMSVVTAHHPAQAMRCGRRVLMAAAAVLVLAAVLLIPAPQARAASVTGTLKGGQGYKVVLVQGNGLARKVEITKSSGAFSLSARRLSHATLHLVRADGSYFGPVVLKATLKQAFCTFAGRADLRLGAISLKQGYALAARAPLGRYDTHSPYAVTATRGKPIGAGKAGRVRVGKLLGYQGDGGDLDRDGLIGAFDIDDNGNRILDNADLTGRGEQRPGATVAPRTAAARVASSAGMPPGPEPERIFRIGSNFRLPSGGAYQDTGEVRVNANIPGIENVDALIDTVLPPALLIAMPVMSGTGDGSTATLDGLGNAWVPEHTVGSFTYPMYEKDPSVWGEDRLTAGHSKGTGLLDLVAAAGRQGDAFVYPGATASQITPGDAFIQRLDDGTEYAGVLNFVFNTVPVVKSYRFGDGPVTELTYDARGVPANDGVLAVPSGATTVTLTCWRPQRKAAPGEAGSGTGDWVDMGNLSWEAPPQPWAYPPNAHDALPIQIADDGYIVSATSDTVAGTTPITVEPDSWSVADTAADTAADPANTISLTLDLSRMLPQWGTDAIPSGSLVQIDLGARAAFGDLASSRVWFRLP